jgi:hypothetical protein
MLNKYEIETIQKALAVAEEESVIDYETVARLHDYIADEITVQEKNKNSKKLLNREV